MDYTVWEEDLLDDDRATLHDSAGKLLGSVEQVINGEWQCKYGDTILGYEPDMEGAKALVSKYHAARTKGKGAK